MPGPVAPAGVEGGRVPHPPLGKRKSCLKTSAAAGASHARAPRDAPSRCDHRRPGLGHAGSLAGIRRLALISASLMAVALVPAPALAASADVSATEVYVRANYALVSSAHARLGVAEATLQALLRRVRRQCPKVAAGSPQNTDSEALTFELVGEMRLAATRPNAGAVGRFARAVARLHWSNAKLTNAVRSYAAALRKQSQLAIPDVCAEVGAWVSSGFQTLPDGTTRFNRALPEYVAMGMLPTRLMAPYVTSSQRGLLQRTRHLEEDISEMEAFAVETWGQIMDELALNP
jgi:hypothetical protein